MDIKKKPQRSHDFNADAEEALQAAHDMPPGPEQIAALKQAGVLRNAEDIYGLIFANAAGPRSDGLIGKE